MRDPNNPCLFCTPRKVTRQNEFAYCTRDSYPVSRGHTLIIPFRHCSSLFELTPEEMSGCFHLLLLERHSLDTEFNPDGYNVGVNIGQAAGQSVLHVHLPVIPRYRGDHPRPQGGIRHLLPDKADYPRGTGS